MYLSPAPIDEHIAGFVPYCQLQRAEVRRLASFVQLGLLQSLGSRAHENCLAFGGQERYFSIRLLGVNGFMDNVEITIELNHSVSDSNATSVEMRLGPAPSRKRGRSHLYPRIDQDLATAGAVPGFSRSTKGRWNIATSKKPSWNLKSGAIIPNLLLGFA